MSVDLPKLHNVLRDPTRAKILELLDRNGPIGYVELQSLLQVAHTGKLNYHLKLLGDLVTKDEQSGKYNLTEKGRLALNLLGKFQTVSALSSSQIRRRIWLNRAAIAVAGMAMVLSVFFVVIGVPFTNGSIGESCSLGSGCTQTVNAVTNGFNPTPWALFPLAAGGTVVVGLVSSRKVISWTGTILLTIFSFVSLFSIGLLYLLLVPFLVGLLAAIPTATRQRL
jgi:hypothetical protein